MIEAESMIEASWIMAKSLVIVESPAKAKTINKYLGPDYMVKASMGHVMDLPKKDLGVDIEKNFKPTYHIIPSRKDVIQELRSAAKKADAVYLAADPDREGEAICANCWIRRNRKSTVCSSTKSRATPSKKPSSIPERLTRGWWTPSRRGGFWIGWWAIR